MKKLLTISFLALLSACGAKESENEEQINVLKNLQISVDTVQIDVGEELFNPGAYYLMDLNADQSKVYFFYPENEIHEIDLISLKLLKRHVFEEDGPDAMPSYINYMQILPNEEVFFSSSAKTAVHKVTGEKVTGYKLQLEDVEGIPDDAGYSLTNSIFISPDKSTILSLPNSFGEPIQGLAVIKTKEMSAKLLDLPALELTKNFQIVFREGNGASAVGDFQKIQFLNDLFLIHSGSTAEVYSYDWRSDTLKLHSFPHMLVPLSKTGEFVNNPDSRERQRAASKELKKQITYSGFVWDEKRQMYFRFDNMNWQYNDEGRFVKSDVYLFSYDKDLSLTGEKKVEELKHTPFGGFMKDGKLYTDTEQGENPAFIVYTFNF